MDLFTRFNRKNIDDRQIDTLIGISKGLIADGKVNQAEAEFLMNWLAQSRQASDNPIILNLLEKVSSMLEDGILDADESSELLSILRKVTGEPSEFGEIAKTSSLPIDYPIPPITVDYVTGTNIVICRQIFSYILIKLLLYQWPLCAVSRS